MFEKPYKIRTGLRVELIFWAILLTKIIINYITGVVGEYYERENDIWKIYCEEVKRKKSNTKELAEQLYVTESAVSKWERGVFIQIYH